MTSTMALCAAVRGGARRAAIHAHPFRGAAAISGTAPALRTPIEIKAARRKKHSIEELTKRTPADGMIAGVGRVNGDRFDDEAARCMILSYDYTVLAGTQGNNNHKKKDRMFELAERWKIPTVFFTEGGGGSTGGGMVLING